MAGPSFDTLLAHEGFLRVLARSLVFDEQRADDLVQQTYLTALVRPPRRDGVRGWLGRVLRNTARQVARSERRRTRREAQAARPEAVARAGLQRRTRELLIAAVLDLDEPYRSTILLRFFEELPPREVAARQGVPVETVRTRTRRGLARLRSALEKEPDLREVGWSVALLGLVLEPGRGRALPLATLLGGAMKLKLSVLVALVAVILVAWQIVPSRAGGRAPASDVAATTTADAAAVDAPGKDAAARPAHGPPDPVRMDAVVLRGRLVPAPGAKPARADLEVRLEGHTDEDDIVRGEAGEDGTFSLDVARLARGDHGPSSDDTLLLVVNHPWHLSAVEPVFLEKAAGAVLATPVEVVLRPAGAARGRVVDVRGAGLPDARVALFALDGGTPRPEPLDTARTDASGGYWLRAGGDGTYLVAATTEGRRPGHALVPVAVGDVADAGAITLADGAAVEGRVFLNGAEAPGAVVGIVRQEAGIDLEWQRLRWAGGRLVRGELARQADSNGRFVLDGLDEGDHALRCVGMKGLSQTARAELPVRVVTVPVVGVRLDVGIGWVRIVLRAGATPLPNQPVLVWKGTSGRGEKMDERGEKTLGFLPGERYGVSVPYPPKGFGTARIDFRAPPAGKTVDVHVDLPPAAPEPRQALASLIVRLTGGEPLPPAVGLRMWRLGETPVQGHEADGSTRTLWSIDGTDGVYRVDNLPPGRWRVVVRPGGWLNGRVCVQEAETQVDLPPDAALDVALETRCGGRLRVVARSPAGRPVEADCRIEDAAGRRVFVEFFRYSIDAWHSSSFDGIGDGLHMVEPALPPGSYRVVFEAEGFARTVREVRLEAGATETVDVTFAPR